MIWSSTELVGYLHFPYLAQVFCLKRSTTDLHAENPRSEVLYGITSLSAQKASPQKLLTLNRGHWSIENKVHWVRDVTFDEDRCRIRKGKGAQVMASLRNLALSVLRMAGAHNIAQALRCCSWNPNYPLRLIGLAIP